MLITHLGKARTRLLATLAGLTDEQINQPAGARWSAAQIVHHLAACERGLAADILAALAGPEQAVDERSAESLRAELDKLHDGQAPQVGRVTRTELVRWLEESRFRDLQRVFNETHEHVLACRSVRHPLFGAISLKNLVDLVWLHDECHIADLAACGSGQDAVPGHPGNPEH